MSKSRSIKRQAARRKKDDSIMTIGEKFCRWLDKIFKKGGTNAKG